MDKIMRVYMPIFMLFLWATLTINHYLRDLNWMPLMWLFIPLFAMVYFSIKEQLRIDEES